MSKHLSNIRCGLVVGPTITYSTNCGCIRPRIDGHRAQDFLLIPPLEAFIQVRGVDITNKLRSFFRNLKTRSPVNPSVASFGSSQWNPHLRLLPTKINLLCLYFVKRHASSSYDRQEQTTHHQALLHSQGQRLTPSNQELTVNETPQMSLTSLYDEPLPICKGPKLSPIQD